ncbi:MAG: extracellular solute-binding protein [Candidatus Latescibacteria bacterium]|nr:extracellular solute-binding protein [Candidatus Latescibacterota bacterium]
MKRLFLVCFLLLTLAGIATWLTEPDMGSEVPVIYWATDPNPARIEQVAQFHQWLVQNGHTTPEGKPVVELRLETVSADRKGVIQGVSGVAADIMDCSIPWYQSIGLLADVTDEAKRYGFGIDQTYSALEPLLTVEGRQYGFPCNVNVMGLWVNVETFDRLGLEPPPAQWDFETFEEIGKEFVRRANKPGERQTVFFLNNIQHAYMIRALHRSLGASEFNETMTKSDLDHPGYAGALAKIHQWTYVDHIAASAAEESAFAAESGYSGAGLALFNRGNYGMYVIGRWCLIRLRQFDEPPRVSVSHFPYGEFPNAIIGTRAAAVYAGSKHVEKAKLFLAYLASQAYNDQIVTSADALPPNPAYTQTETYLRPAQYPNEWGAHQVPATGAETIAIASSASPFVPAATVDRYKKMALDKVMANIVTPQEAAAEAAQRIDAEIELTLKDSPSLRRKYGELIALQEKIDQYRQEGRKVPLEWIKNPFHRRYYIHQGWAVEETADVD